jgi:hypothetical protein
MSMVPFFFLQKRSAPLSLSKVLSQENSCIGHHSSRARLFLLPPGSQKVITNYLAEKNRVPPVNIDIYGIKCENFPLFWW